MAYEDRVEISDWFWDILHAAEQSPDRLRDTLMELDRDQIQRFMNEFDRLAAELTVPPYTHHVDKYVRESEDALYYLTRWVVSQGKEFYNQVRARPALMPPNERGRRDPFAGVAVKVFYSK